MIEGVPRRGDGDGGGQEAALQARQLGAAN